MRAFYTAIGAAFLFASPASAAVVNITVTGTVQSGNDGLGLFGATNQSLSGRPFILAFAYDTANPIETTFGRDVNGGTSVNQPSPILHGDVTIGAVTLSAIEPYYAQYVRYRFSNETALQFRTESAGGLNGASFQWSRRDQVIPLSLDAPIMLNFGAGDRILSSFSRVSFAQNASTFAFFTPQSIAVAPKLAAVPEPMSWSLLIIGFGVAGGVLRRRSYWVRMRSLLHQ
ncbi:MAG TPA: PEPxxWA-CTERM sorting domain-containing protein [Sphingomonas sp.]|nr:PEPxxWA-CTERM sorting domain-containing protein [Sphingomonas sp.]